MASNQSPQDPVGNVDRRQRTNSKKSGDGSSRWLEDHLEALRQNIVKKASACAKADGRDETEPRDIAQAALLFAPGKQFPASTDAVPFLTRMGITGVTLMSCLLAAAFGVIGAYQTRAGNAQIASGAFDIAKIFAGAIVGSTGAAVAARARP